MVRSVWRLGWGVALVFAAASCNRVEPPSTTKNEGEKKNSVAAKSDDAAARDAELQAALKRVSARPFIDQGVLGNPGLDVADLFVGNVSDEMSLAQFRAAMEHRGAEGLVKIREELRWVRTAQPVDPHVESELLFKLGKLHVYEGDYGEAAKAIQSALVLDAQNGVARDDQLRLIAYLGILSLRQGEIDNCIGCVGPSSCIFPIDPAATHKHDTGSRRAIEYFTKYLDEKPGDLRVRWLLNLAYMTLGEYPGKVPAKYRVDFPQVQSEASASRFQNVALDVGLTARGPNLAGGSVFDDFTNDGLPDLLITSLDLDRGASFYVNRGDGTFAERSDEAGLAEQVHALNAVAADYDNDGRLDVLLLRGGWDRPMRMSLLRNKGDGIFEDVTLDAGLGMPISSESAVWGDFDNDGLLDLFVCGEFVSPGAIPNAPPPPGADPRNRCRLYHNLGQGKFVDVAAEAGVLNEQCAKGSAWGDYDGDGRIDLYVSNMNGGSRLYHNDGGGKFHDVAPELGVTGPPHGFACWFWDFDNDGFLDIYVNDYSIYLADVVAAMQGLPVKNHSSPTVYRGLPTGGFRDVAQEVHLDRPIMAMGCNFGDIDNDGFLDLYFGTGRMSLEQLVPNLLFKNDRGTGFRDVTLATGTGHLQKGHGIAFADFDRDGHLDLFVEAGGATPGDKSFNLLFKNTATEGNWLRVRLVGTLSNRSALGARIRATVTDAAGQSRTVFRTVGGNSSFGGNGFEQLLGLGDALQVDELCIRWPQGKTQVFYEIAAGQTLVITEGLDETPTVPQGLRVPSE